ncbi:hypothetical protein GT037_009553 [Alternaria burnsii]|uniref:Retrovirus-related Pol polyprotein from transposon TNT 1-94-like beta-barrel domain-containing protein n=1 Tax=Alternaria burnsii TaxID=1187904 RepID=A0A8H7EAG1_9PLEO|nr:uncharacterized protein GT037_009553 [Alternaria burnsii]KAF7672522.1 hypothetical protein GT037_009553 [Alternaria burnsii]
MNTDTDSRLCPTWVFLSNANVHIAKDRGWFKTYTPFTSKVDPSLFFNPGNHIPVLGTGTVEIPIKRSPNSSGVSSHASLLLHEVLHVPDFLCNVIGQPLWLTDRYNPIIKSSTKSKGNIKDSEGKSVAYFHPGSPLLAIKVRSPLDWPKLGPHALKKDRLYMLACQWAVSEKQRWREFQAANGLSTPAQNAVPYTAEETAFLKKNYGSESHFLMQHGLKIFSDEYRQEGQAILRAIMQESDMSEEDIDDNEDDFDESELEGHQADYNFTERQLGWIERNFRKSEQSMYSYGLKFYDDEDLEAAKALAEAMVRRDD